jgi:hypothetical protein
MEQTALSAQVNEVAESAAAPSSRKRAKKVHSQPGDSIKRRGRKKSLSQFIDMPLDVIFEASIIFNCLYAPII